MQHRIGDLADPELQRAAVFDQHRDVLADTFGDRVHRRRRQLEQLFPGFHPGIDLADVDEALPAGDRHPRVDLRNHPARRVAGRGNNIDGNTERAVTVLIRRTDRHQRGVQRQDLVQKQPRNLREETRRVIAVTVRHGIACAGPQEERVDLEQIAVLFPGPGVLTQGEHVDDFDVVQALAVLDEVIDQRIGHSGIGANEDAVARLE